MKVEDLVVDDVWLWLAGGPGGPEDVVEEVEEVGGDEEGRVEGEGQGGDDDDGGREPCRKLSIQVQGGSRLKESSGCLALKNSESESAIARPGQGDEEDGAEGEGEGRDDDQGKVVVNDASVAQLVEAIETKSRRRDGAAAVEVVQEEREAAWLLASQVSELADGEATAAGRAWVGQRGTSVEVAGAHPRTTVAAEVCEEETDTGSVAAAAADGAASAAVDATAVPRDRQRRKRLAEAAAAITEGSCSAGGWLAKAMVEAGGEAGGAEAMVVTAKAMAEARITKLMEVLQMLMADDPGDPAAGEIRTAVDATVALVDWLAMVLADERAAEAVVDGAAAAVARGAAERASARQRRSERCSE